MKHIYISILSVAILAVSACAQVLEVEKNSGVADDYSVPSIASITFTIDGSGDTSSGAIQLMWIHTDQGAYQFLNSEIDSMYFNSESSIIHIQTGQGNMQFALSAIDSITFSPLTDSTVYITYLHTTVSVINPFKRIAVDVEHADVTVTSTAATSDIKYVLSGSTDDGSFKLYSDNKVIIELDDLVITNNDGPAINIQTGKKVTIYLADGTSNKLSDGAVYADPPNDEDQDAAFFSEGQLVFEGAGSLDIYGNGTDQHALASDDYIKITNGSITVHSAVKDGIHAKDGFFLNGGTVNIASSGDGIDGDENIVEITGGTLTIITTTEDQDAIKTDSTIAITGGAIHITVNGDMGKGINAGQGIAISGGVVDIYTSGKAVLEASGSGYEPSYCTAIASDKDVSLSNAVITINTVGAAGRGISINGNLTVNSGTLAITSSGSGAKYTNELGQPDAYHGPCIKADGNIAIVDGAVTIKHSGAAGKGISCDGDIAIGKSGTAPEVNVTTSGKSVTISSGQGPNAGDYAEAKAISAEGEITIESGTIAISSADDGIKSGTKLSINGGTITIKESVEGMESPIIHVNAGTIKVTASDDAFNATYGNGGETNDGSDITINGGYVYLNASRGDALDSNGNLTINGGTVLVHGPQSQPEVGVDVNGNYLVNGGYFIAAEPRSNMSQMPDNTSTQNTVICGSNQGISAGTLIHIEDGNGNELATFAPNRSYSNIIFSSSSLKKGETYKVYTGGTSTGTLTDGLYTGGAYSGGTLKKTFTLSSTVQTVTF